MLKVPGLWDACCGKLPVGSMVQREKCAVVNKAERSCTLTSDMEMQSLEFVPSFDLALVHY